MFDEPLSAAGAGTPSDKKGEVHSDPDVRLMLAVRAGDLDAFERLVRKYQSQLVRVFEQIVDCRFPAEDIAQEVFLRVYRARKNYRPRARFSTWLFTIANNVVRNAKRERARRIQTSTRNGGDGDDLRLDETLQADSGLMPLRRLERKELGQVVRRALATLGDRQRMVLLLSKFENMNYKEIATAMSISRSSVKSLACRGRARLRAILEPYVRASLM